MLWRFIFATQRPVKILRMDISDSAVDRIILGLGTKGTTGIFGVMRRLDTLFPSSSISSKYEVADRRFRELLRGGHVQLVRQFLGRTERTELIPDTEVDAILRSSITWFPMNLGTETSQVSYETTDLGERLYQQIP